ncbi:phage portal protein [Arthrobacter sp. B2a2-09]|uniref:phage portal protein n=1 Tax=Arthrobacter sp. B2a2-09 TaxID=2952822 RepID=UPI0022CD820F|nr:phage portal protein [Arthrobacter sp. B2a2-09]MCZ9883714.1 phage portal protein [Arthrobacter sp. B2a2-09]
MGIFDKRGSKLYEFATQSAYSTEPLIQSPWSTATLQSLVFPNVANTALPVSVDEAMAIPAVSAAIGIYSGVCSRFPIQGPDWLSNTQGAVTPQLRIAATVQDLIFQNGSVWFVARGADGYVSDAVRVHPNRWSLDNNGNVLIDQKPVDQNSIIYFSGLKPQGFLVSARTSVRHAAALERTILNRAANPSPITVIAETQQQEASAEEIDAMISDYTTARQNDNGGILFQPFGLEVKDFGGSDSASQMLIAARMAVRTDLANHLNIASGMVDGTTGNSDVYSNALQSKSELLELSLKLFTEPIADRLSQPDVVPPGVKVSFDYSSFDVTADAKGNTTNPTPAGVIPNV